MAFYQVLLSLESDTDKLRSVLTDLTEKDLKARFLSPYKKGKNLICGNEVIPVQQIRRLHIVCTVQNDQVERDALQERSFREIQEFNRQSDSVALISVGRGYEPEDILEVGEDVTGNYISGPPGDGATVSLATKVVNHPWIVAIGTGLIVAALAALLGLG